MPKPTKAFFPCSLTVISLMLGVTSIIFLQEKNFFLAAILISIGSVLDVMDGQLAERLKSTSEIGKQLDSLADMVTFGVAPSILIYNLLLSVGVIQPLAILVSLVFVVGGAYRLARFNTLPSNRNADFIGLPIPAGCILIVTGSFWQHWVVHLWWTAIIIITSFLMVSNFRYPKLKQITRLPPSFWILFSYVIIICWLFGGWEAIPFGLCLMYGVSGPVLWLRHTILRRADLRRA